MKNKQLNFDQIYSDLKEKRFENLPGIEAQLKMAPLIREDDIRKMGAGKTPTHSAVMVLLYPAKNGFASLVLIKRTDFGGAHSGQISFPGGKFDATDQSLLNTALRETHEEVGIRIKEGEVIGKLTDLYIPPSNFLVSPFLAATSITPKFLPDTKEVASLIEVDVRELFKPENRRVEKIRLQEGFIIETPCFLINGHIVWGATAMIINEFLEFFSN